MLYEVITLGVEDAPPRLGQLRGRDARRTGRQWQEEADREVRRVAGSTASHDRRPRHHLVQDGRHQAAVEHTVPARA